MAETPATRCTATATRTARPTAQPPGQVLDGSADGWGELVERYSKMLWSIAGRYRLSAADSADVFQTTWMRLVEHIGTIKDPECIGGWLATTARNECTRVLRQSRRQIPVGDELPEPVDDTWEPAARLMLAERDSALWDAVAKLRPADQALLRTLMADPALSYREISDALGVPIGSIGPTRARAIERLRRELELAGALHEACTSRG